MADFALPQAIQFDQTPNQLLYKIGEDARQERALKQKMEYENRQKQGELLKEINPATLYPKFKKSVVDASINALTTNVSNFLKVNPNANNVELQSYINKELSTVAQWSAKTDEIETLIDKNISSIDANSPYNKSSLRALAIDKALYKTDDKNNKVLKSPEEMDINTDYVGEVAKRAPHLVIDAYKGQEIATKLINDSQLFTTNEERTIETPDGKKTTVLQAKNSVPFYLEAKGGTIGVKRTGGLKISPQLAAKLPDDQKEFVEAGYVDEGVYQRFNSNPAMKVWIDAGAQDLLMKTGIKDNGEAGEFFKRAFLTKWLEDNKKGAIENVDKTLYSKPSAIFNIGTGAAPRPENPDFTAPIDRLRAITNGDTRFLGDPKKSARGQTMYDVTSQFKSLPIYQTVGTKKFYGPKEVSYFPNYDNSGQAKIVIKQKEGKPYEVLSVQAFSDLLIPKTEGTGYDTKPKPTKKRPY